MSSTKFQDLNLSNGFLFPAALEDPVTCRLVLECMVEEPIEELSVKVEYTKLYNSEFKCIRLDVFSKDKVTEVAYNLEMQNKNNYNLPLRSRYYQAQLDVANLEPGDDYQDLKPLYVIFICNFDPFGMDLYRYTFAMQCKERDFPLNDGVKRIFFNTKGKNANEVPSILLDFLGYLNNSTDDYIEEHPNGKITEIHNRVKLLKKKRDVEARYMHYLYVDEVIAKMEKEIVTKETLLKEIEDKAKEAEGKAKEAEGKAKEANKVVVDMLLEVIAELGEVPETISKRIEIEEDLMTLKLIHKAAIKVNSIEQLEKAIANL